MNFEDTFIGRPNTVRTYKGLYKHWIRDENIDVLYCEWHNANLSPRTIKILFGIYSKYQEFLGNPKPELRSIKKLNSGMIPPQPPRALDKLQLKSLCSTWDKLYPKHEGFLFLGGHAGLRLGEALGLQWQDVDLLKGNLEILRSYSITLGEYGPTKNGKGRIVPLSKDLELALIKRYNYLGSALQDPVFTCSGVNPKLRRACTKAKVPSITFHALRHTFATLALESGQSIKTVSETLGHSQVSTTINQYWNLLNKRLNLDFLE